MGFNIYIDQWGIGVSAPFLDLDLGWALIITALVVYLFYRLRKMVARKSGAQRVLAQIRAEANAISTQTDWE